MVDSKEAGFIFFPVKNILNNFDAVHHIIFLLFDVNFYFTIFHRRSSLVEALITKLDDYTLACFNPYMLAKTSINY